nr:ATP-binding protein [Magnetospirillum sulfuroxidans]
MLRNLARDEQRLSSLRESERRRRMAQFSLDHCADMVVWTNDQSRIVFANKALHDRLAYDDQSLLGKNVGDIDPNYPQEDWHHRMAELRKAGRLRVESSLRDSAGQLISAEVSVNLFHMDGQDYTCAIIRDTVERKQSEALLAERTRRLEASNAELEQFAYVASHDLREPLRMVSSFVGLLERQFGQDMSAEAREYVKFAREGAVRMDRLILDLLEYSRAGASGRPLAVVALSQVVANVHHNLSVALNEAQARLSLPAALPKVWGDEDELGRVLTNLISNALKYRHPDRVPEIELTVESHDDQVTCVIHDNGIGIAPQYFDRIFRIFQRLHGRERYEGTGIGLAICKKIVEHHGGRIWVSSAPDQGTTFFFTLKLATPS